jgi:hypothetical protein
VQEDTFDISDASVYFTYIQDRYGEQTSDRYTCVGERLHLNDLVVRRLMPMLVLGSGMASLASKLHLLLHAIKLEVPNVWLCGSPRRMNFRSVHQSYSKSICCIFNMMQCLWA